LVVADVEAQLLQPAQGRPADAVVERLEDGPRLRVAEEVGGEGQRVALAPVDQPGEQARPQLAPLRDPLRLLPLVLQRLLVERIELGAARPPHPALEHLPGVLAAEPDVLEVDPQRREPGRPRPAVLGVAPALPRSRSYTRKRLRTWSQSWSGGPSVETL